MSKIRVLIVDDHILLRRAVCRLLESRAEFEVCGEAEDGAEAVEKASHQRPDVVILDIMMPKMNGFDAALKIRNVSPRSQIVMLSSHKDKQLLEEATKVGAVCYVPQSEAERELIDAVKAAAGRSLTDVDMSQRKSIVAANRHAGQVGYSLPPHKEGSAWAMRSMSRSRRGR